MKPKLCSALLIRVAGRTWSALAARPWPASSRRGRGPPARAPARGSSSVRRRWRDRGLPRRVGSASSASRWGGGSATRTRAAAATGPPTVTLSSSGSSIADAIRWPTNTIPMPPAMKSIPPVVALVAGHVAEEEGEPEGHGGAADPAGGAPPDRGAVVREGQADADEEQAGAGRLEVGGQADHADRQARERRERERGGGAVAPAAIEPAGPRAGTPPRAPARACRWWPGRARRSRPPRSRPSTEVAAGVDDLAGRRVDDVAGGLERLADARAPKKNAERVERGLEDVLGELEHREPERDEPRAQEERATLAGPDRGRCRATRPWPR